jgi:hypothetical protein
MSFEELNKIMQGETLSHPVNWSEEGNASTSSGFCFLGEKTSFKVKDGRVISYDPIECYSFLSGIVTEQVLVEFELVDDNAIKIAENCRYADPSTTGEHDYIYIKEYYINEYNSEILKPLRINIGFGYSYSNFIHNWILIKDENGYISKITEKYKKYYSLYNLNNLEEYMYHKSAEESEEYFDKVNKYRKEIFELKKELYNIDPGKRKNTKLLYRYMSFEEAEKLMNGETLYRKTEANIPYFSFFEEETSIKLKDGSIKICSNPCELKKYIGDIVSDQILIEFEVLDSSLINATEGIKNLYKTLTDYKSRYEDCPDDRITDYIINEYHINYYNNKILLPLRFNIDSAWIENVIDAPIRLLIYGYGEPGWKYTWININRFSHYISVVNKMFLENTNYDYHKFDGRSIYFMLYNRNLLDDIRGEDDNG